MDGEGQILYPDGRKYTGEFENDKKQGIGTFEWRKQLITAMIV